MDTSIHNLCLTNISVTLQTYAKKNWWTTGDEYKRDNSATWQVGFYFPKSMKQLGEEKSFLIYNPTC